MRIRIAAIGKFRGAEEQRLYDVYLRRLPWDVRLIELQDSRSGGGAQARKAREAALLRHACASCERLVALDEGGNMLDSPDFAAHLADWRDEGMQDIGFLIGGADGLDAELRRSAHLVLSLGRMTWPHLLVRALLAEQLYRAYTIGQNHPYHRS